jgi:putative membrane protein insertion efficiency factor
MNIAQRGLVFIIRIYQLTISPALAAALGPPARCRFTPSCSEYAREAIRLHGAIRGGCLAARRLGRCHPWGESGEDFPPLPEDYKGVKHGTASLPPNFHHEVHEATSGRLRRTPDRSGHGSTESRPIVSTWKAGHCHGS